MNFVSRKLKMDRHSGDGSSAANGKLRVAERIGQVVLEMAGYITINKVGISQAIQTVPDWY